MAATAPARSWRLLEQLLSATQWPRLLAGPRSLGASIALLGALGAGSTAWAGDNTWTNGGFDSTWNTSSANWTSPTVWNNDFYNADSAIFGLGGVGPITVSGTINVRSLNFGTTTGYSFNGGTLRISRYGTGTLGVGTINVGGATGTLTGVNATINSNIQDGVGLIKTGDGTLTLGGTGNSFTGMVAIGGSTYGANILIGNATTTAFGGRLEIGSASVLPPTTTVAIGFGILDIGANNVTLGGLTFAQTRPNVTYVANAHGVIGSGALTINGGPIRAVGNITGWANYVNTAIDTTDSLMRIEVGSSGNVNREVMFLQSIGTGTNNSFGLLKTYGVGTTGAVSLGSFTMLGNNLYTGATTINGGTANVVGGTNASTALRIANATLTLQGANGSFGAATQVVLAPTGVLTLSNTAALTSTNEPALPAANLDNRINTAAALTLAGGNFAMVGAASAGINQTLASINAASGFSQISLTNGTGQTAILNVTGNLTQSAGAQLLIRGTALANTGSIAPTNTRFIVNGTLPAEVNGLIPGFYGNATSATGNATSFVRNNATPGVGLAILQASDYTLNSFAGGPTANVDLTTAQTISANQSANAIRTSVGITVNGGNTLDVGAGGLLTTAGVTIAGPGTVNFGGNPGYLMNGSTGTVTFSGPVTGSNGLFVGGAGIVTFTGDLSGLTGGYTNNSGTTNFNTATFGASQNITIRQGTVASNNAAFGTGTGTVTLGDPNTPAGTSTIATLNISNAAITTFARPIVTVGSDGTAPYSATSGLTLSTATTVAQNITGAITLGTHLTINSGGTNNTTFSGLITGGGGLHVLGGVVVVNNASNSYAGGTQLQAGTLVAAADALGTGNLRLFGGTVRTDYAGNFSRGLTMVGAGTINTNGNNINMTGGISGENPNANLTKSGAGTLTVNGSGTFAGQLLVTAGEVRLAGPSGALFGRGTTTVSPTATLTLDNTAANNNNRFTRDVTLTGATTSTFQLIGNASTATDQSVGALFVSGGTVAQPHTVNIVAAGQATILRFASFQPTAGANILFSGTNLGALDGATGSYSRIFFDIAPVADGGIIAGAQFNGFGGTGLVAYSFTRGVIRYTVPASSGTVVDNFGTDGTPPTGGPVDANSEFTTTGDTTVKMGAALAGLIIDGGNTVTLRRNVYGPAPENLNAASDTFLLTGPGGGAATLRSLNGAKTIQMAGIFPGNIDVGPGGLNVDTQSNLTIENPVFLIGAGGISKSGAATLTINSTANSFAGSISVSDGTLNLNGSASTTAAINVSGGVFNLAANIGTTAGINITGGTLNIQPGAFVPGGNAVVVSGTGLLNINNSSTFSVSGVTGNGTVNIGTGSTLFLNVPGAATVGATLTGPGALQYTPTAVSLLTISGNNSFGGGVTGNANSRYIVNTPTAFGTGTVDLSAQTASSSFSTPTVGFDFGAGGTGTVANDFILSSAAIDTFFIARTNINQVVTISGLISGGSPTGRLVWDESGASQSSVLRLTNANNSFTSPVRVDFGSVAITSDGALGNAANGLFLNGGNTTTNGSLRLDASVTTNRTITISGTSAINTNVNDFAVDGVLAGASPLTKLGVGNLNLNNAGNTFTGVLNVNGGRVNVNGNLPTSTNAVNVNNGGVLGGVGTITRNITVNGGGIVSPGMSPGVLSVTGNVTFLANSAFEVEINGLNPGLEYDQLFVNGNVNLGNANLGGSVGFLPSLGDRFWILVKPTLSTITGTFNGLAEGSFLELGGIQFQITYTASFAGLTGAGTGNDVMLTVTAIPEPTTLAAFSMMVLGTGGVWFKRRRRVRDRRRTRRSRSQ